VELSQRASTYEEVELLIQFDPSAVDRKISEMLDRAKTESLAGV
jgi:hypothetical protein